MVPYRIIFHHKKTGDEVVASGTFQQDLWSQLQAFRDEARRLSETDWAKADYPGTYRVHFDAGSMSVEHMDAPRDATLAEFLHVARPFLLQSEGLYFPRINSQLYKALEHPLLRSLVARNRAMYDAKDMRAAFIVQANELELNSERAFDLWLDAFQYHRHGKDASRRERFLREHGGPPDDLAEGVFRDMLRGKALAIANTAAFVTSIEKSPTYAASKASTGVA